MNYNDFIPILFGHLIGDFVLQPTSLAVKKSTSNLICSLHVLIYTLSVAAFTNWDLRWLGLVFVSHWIIDRFSLADKWAKTIGGRELEGFIKYGHLDIPDMSVPQENNYRILRGGFTALVYVVTDQTFHLLPMFYVFEYLTTK